MSKRLIEMAPHAVSSPGVHRPTSSAPAAPPSSLFVVDSPDVVYGVDEIKTKYTYRTTSVTRTATGQLRAQPKETVYDFKVDRRVGRVGMMLVGWGGNNGSTVTAGILANRQGMVWDTREGRRAANYFGSLLMGATMKLGGDAEMGRDVNIPFHQILPMAHPNDLVIGGWDINGMNLADAMDRAQVLEPSLKAMVRKEMSRMRPLPSIYYPDFIAANQMERADNLLEGSHACMAHLDRIRQDIRCAIRSWSDSIGPHWKGTRLTTEP